MLCHVERSTPTAPGDPSRRAPRTEATDRCKTAALHGSDGGGAGITLVGLLLETASGVRRRLIPSLDEQIGVGGQSFAILIRLSRSGGRLRMADLAAQTGLTPSGLTRALDRLAEAGLAAREGCPHDRRVAYACLTPSGQQRVARALARHEHEIAELLEGLLSESEALQLAVFLRRLRDRVAPCALDGAGGSDSTALHAAARIEQASIELASGERASGERASIELANGERATGGCASGGEATGGRAQGEQATGCRAPGERA
jgi:MarR family 2-MHQ and catechol resistance regulon transcriptional repressor